MYTEFLMSMAPTIGDNLATLKAAILQNYSDPEISFKALALFPEMVKTIANPNGELRITAIAVLESTEPFPAFKQPDHEEKNNSRSLHSAD